MVCLLTRAAITCTTWLDAASSVSLVDAGGRLCCCPFTRSVRAVVLLPAASLRLLCTGLPLRIACNLLLLSAATLRVRHSQPLLCCCLQPSSDCCWSVYIHP